MPSNTLDKVKEFYTVEETGNPHSPYKLIGKRGAVYYLMRTVDGKKVGTDTPLFAVSESGKVTKLRGLATEWVWDEAAIQRAAPEAAKKAAERISARRKAADQRAKREVERKAQAGPTTQDGTPLLRSAGIQGVVATVHGDGIVLDADDPKKLASAIKFLTESGNFNVSKHTGKADADGVFWADLSIAGAEPPKSKPTPKVKAGDVKFKSGKGMAKPKAEPDAPEKSPAKGRGKSAGRTKAGPRKGRGTKAVNVRME